MISYAMKLVRKYFPRPSKPVEINYLKPDFSDLIQTSPTYVPSMEQEGLNEQQIRADAFCKGLEKLIK